MILFGNKPEEFVWATGVEDTFVPQTKAGHRSLDEYELMEHYEHWREDLRLAERCGLRALRWGVPWYRVEPRPGTFDWRWCDEVVDFLCEETSLTPIVDLVHFGCPFWLRREFASEDYPAAVSGYATAFTERYRGRLKYYTPLNEPLVNALMCGKRGTWPPYLRGDTGYIRIMLQIAKGIQRTVSSVRAADANAVFVHVEATGLSRAARQDLEVLAAEDQRRGFLCFDLLTGRVGPGHPLFSWLVRNGASPDDLAQIGAAPVPIDVMGMNFYPQWSTKQLYLKHGKLAYRSAEHDGPGFQSLIEDYYRRYGRPIMITETSAAGPDEIRENWLDESVKAIRALRSRGVPVVGYTWFPLFTMIDWRYRLGSGPLEDYRIELGLFRLRGQEGVRWEPTALAEAMRRLTQSPEASVGQLRALPRVRPHEDGTRSRVVEILTGVEETAGGAPEAPVPERSETILADGRRFYFYGRHV